MSPELQTLLLLINRALSSGVTQGLLLAMNWHDVIHTEVDVVCDTVGPAVDVISLRVCPCTWSGNSLKVSH